MKKNLIKSESRVISSELVIPPAARVVVVLGLYSGAGVSTVVDYVKANTASRLPPPLVLDRGMLPYDGLKAHPSVLEGKFAFIIQEPPGQIPPKRLADIVILLGHELDAPKSSLPIYQMIDAIYHKAGLPSPHIISRYKGMGDYPDTVMSSKKEMTDKLLWLMAKAFFPQSSPDFELAKRLFDGERQDREIEETNKNISNKL